MVIQNSHGEILPGKYLHHVFQVACLAPLDVSVVDRHDLEAEAVLDQEGWCVIIIRNVTDVPVSISPLEPITIVITPARREDQAAWRREVDAVKARHRKS